MSEEINESNEVNDVNEERIVMQILITKDGQLKVVSSLMQDKTACYGILETAKDLIREHNHAVSCMPKGIIKPVGGLMHRFARNGNSQ